MHCGAIARLLVVSPCAHLFCLDCIALDKQACPSCRKPYIMQSVSEAARLETNPNPKWDVPKDVIEWQPAYTQKVCAKSLPQICFSHAIPALRVLVRKHVPKLTQCDKSQKLHLHKPVKCVVHMQHFY